MIYKRSVFLALSADTYFIKFHFSNKSYLNVSVVYFLNYQVAWSNKKQIKTIFDVEKLYVKVRLIFYVSEYIA